MGNHDWINAMGINQYHPFSQYVHASDLAQFNNDWNERMHGFSKEGEIGGMIRSGYEIMAVLGPTSARTIFVH